MKNLFFLFLFFLTVSINVKAQNDTTPYVIKGGIYLNHNIHSTDFSRLPGFDFDAPVFEGGSAQKLSFGLGGEYWFAKKFLNMDMGLSLNIIYTDLSAPLINEKRIGNIIDGNSFTDGVAEFRIDPDISYLMIEEAILFKPQIPIGFMLGTKFGFPLNSEFSQQEKLVSPASGYYYETGTDIRDENSGDIPNASPVYFGIDFGIYSDIFQTGNFHIVPEIKFTLPLTNVSADVDWKVYYASAGISIKYNVPAAKPAPPLPPPVAAMPDPPPPPVEQALTLEIDASHEGRALGNWSEIVMPVEEYIYNAYYSLPPVVFFEPNSADLKPVNIESVAGMPLDFPEISPEEIIRKAYNQSSPGKFEVIMYSTTDGDLLNERLGKVKSISGTRNVISNNVSVDMSKLPYEALKEESAKVEFVLPAPDHLIAATSVVDKEYKFPKISINVRPDIDAGAGIQNYYGEVFFNGNKLFSFYEDVIDLDVPNAMKQHQSGIPYFDQDTVTIYVNVLDEENKRIEARHNILIKYDIIRKEFFNKPKNIEPDSLVAGKFILGYFEFDKANFEYLDDKILAIARKAIEEGQEVIIRAHTDNLGSMDYNKGLATRRANAAKVALGSGDNVKIEIPESSPFDNRGPYGRMLNRNVTIEIK